MALEKVTDIAAPGKSLSPNSEAGRINAARANRRLFNGDFSELKIDRVDNETPALEINWFRRAATFFPEFMLAERPTITVTNNPRMEAAIADMGRDMFATLQQANVLMISEGECVIATHPMNPLQFVRYPTDSHYEVVDAMGRVTHDLLIDIRQRGTTRTVDIVCYAVEGRGSFWRQYEYNAGAVGGRIDTFTLPPRAGRQVVSLRNNSETTSLYDDLKSLIGVMARTATGVARREKRNSNPHLAGPEGMLKDDGSGNKVIDSRGMFLPLEQGDPQPSYLYLDTPEQSARWLFKTSEQSMFNLAALPAFLFDPDMKLGNITGRGLERSLLPFRTRVSHYARTNEQALLALFRVWNNNRAVANAEVFQYDDRDVEVEWRYSEIFEDAMGNSLVLSEMG